ncbi:winged helix-turn-helix transcriptional regulator [Actinoalloteichus hymeniacidonis]|uniref:Transcriptional regulator, HxlR family n=1 Tax=Actinoalloteichus hymeniacidonis TaxID=340345 RepID=A0AAC9MYR2_9PSEU|nr:helix-turn-helix domain-containing protein [Actinoalloteichus hymeniacidonis]AOS63719.1 transcriptional regulator, HxlR family [Actinoalloteichus hymeniacidonis]MBB5908228.1 DNA-binding HxlR family transcriptional regulator [Actinoalloteichus hymeniacidonis]
MSGSQPIDGSFASLAAQRADADFEHIDEEVCRSFQRSVEAVGKKWTAAVLLAGLRGARRFVEYRARIPGISNQLLSQRLRELEARRLIERIVVPTTPVQISYRPTERGKSLMRVLHPLVAWSTENE